MALKLKYTDEHGIVHINMSPNSSPALNEPIYDKTDPKLTNKDPTFQIKNKIDLKERFQIKDSKFETKNSKFESKDSKFDLKDPKFDTINKRFGSYDLFGGKYEDYKTDSSGEAPHSLFRSRYNSIEEELANTPYAFATERSLRSANQLDITIDRTIDISPSKDIEDDRFFNRRLSLEYEDAFRENTPAFTVTQLIHAQDRYFDLSKKESGSFFENDADSIFDKDKSFVVKSTPNFENRKVFEKDIEIKEVFNGFDKSSGTDSSSGAERTGIQVVLPGRTNLTSSVDSAFKVLKLNSDVDTQTDPIATTVVPISVRKKEKSFAILTETPAPSRPSSPRSLPVDIRHGRVSPFKGRGFREETSRHNTPRASATNSLVGSRTNSPPPRRRTNSLSKIEKNMASTATLPPPILLTHSPRNFLKENIEGIRQISDLNKEKNQAEAEKKKIEEETAILKEMGLSDKQAKKEAKSLVASRANSRANSRSNSPGKINLRSRSSSPATKLNKDASKSKENINKSKVFINANDGMPKPAKSRVSRSVSKSQPQSKGGSPKHSKIPKRQSSVSPKGTLSRRNNSISRRPPSTNLLSQDARFISNSTSSIHETIRVGSTIHDKRFSQSAQHLTLSPDHIKGKPPISPGRGGPPPANKAINSKRLSPIVGTPNKSPVDDKVGAKPGTKLGVKKPLKTTTNATSKVNSKLTNRDPSPGKAAAKPATTKPAPKPISRTPSTKSITKPATPPKTEAKKPINRTDSMKSLTRTSSTKNLAAKPPLKRSDSKISNKSQSTSKINEVGKKDSLKKKTKSMSDSATDPEEIPKQDSETQYDNLKITNDKGELVIMTKKSIVSMTTAAITSQPLEIVTTVTNQLPSTFEKVREKRNIERLNSRDLLIGKEDTKSDEKKKGDKSHGKSKKEAKEDKDKDNDKSEDSHKLRPLQPPFNDPQLEKVKQKIDDILKTPEISRENILSTSPTSKIEPKFKNLAEKTKTDVKQTKDSITEKLMDMKNQMAEQQKEAVEASTSKIRTEAAKIVDSIITPVEEPKDVPDKVEEAKKNIEPIVMVVNEKKKEVTEKKPEIPEKKQDPVEKKPEVPEKKKEDAPEKKDDTIDKNKEAERKKIVEKKKDLLDAVEKVNETLVKGEAEVEVLSSNVSTPGMEKIKVDKKMVEENGSDRSHSNGGFPQSTSTTPKPPVRTKKEQKDKQKEQSPQPSENETKDDAQNNDHKKPNICSRLMGKCKTKCCPCCIKGEEEKETEELTERRERQGTEESVAQKQGVMSKFSWCKKKTPVEEEVERNLERAAGKGATIEFEDETKRKRKLRDVICCCGRKRRVGDGGIPAQNIADVTMSPGDPPGVVADTGCCGKKRQAERRDSILSDRPPNTCCNNGLTRWMRGMCRRREPPAPTSRRASMFSKNKSLSPTLPPEDTRKKLDPSLIEHTSMIRAAIPILPAVLAYCCLVCNVVLPGLGSIFSGLFCLCFGIPRFGPHDGAKYRIGAFIINLLVGAGQLFTVLFCLVGWGWSIWWGVIMVKISRKYRRLKREAEIAEAEAAAPVTANNHTRA